MQKWISLACIFLLGISFPAHSADWHCLITTSQTSVDFEGKAIRTTCHEFIGIDTTEEAKQKKQCEKGARKNKAKAWLNGVCPIENRIGTCTITKMGPATLPQPRVVHTYEESGGNLNLADEINLARQQCSQMSLNSGTFQDISSGSSAEATVTASDSAQTNVPKATKEEANNNNDTVNKGVEGAKKALESIKGAIFK